MLISSALSAQPNAAPTYPPRHALARLLPHPVGCAALPLHDAAASRQLEAEAAALLPIHTLMRRAGLAVARLARALAPLARRVDVVCGPGNNGGDGFEAALHLLHAGLDVRVLALGDAARLPADAAASLQRAVQAGVVVQAWRGHLPQGADAAGPQDLLIDALLGRGLNRPAEGALAHAIAAMQESTSPVLAVDIPSGLPGDHGAVPTGAAVVRAQATLALLSLAPGLFTGHGRDAVGDLWWDDLGVDLDQQPPVAWLNEDLSPAPLRQHLQHKGSFGDVRVVGGAAQMVGAALLAGRSALHAGAGRVYVHPLDPQAPRLDPMQPDLMFGGAVRPADWSAQTTVLAGCGGGLAIDEPLADLLEQSPRLVLDADALNALARSAVLRQRLQSRRTAGATTVLTPHPLEARRLLESLGQPGDAVQHNRLGSARRLADAFGCVVVLKGSGTVLAAPDEPTWINPTGNAALAVPGSGDVLAGWLAGLWSPWDACSCTALRAARQAVYRHGRLAERLSPDGAPLSASRQAMAID